MTYLETYRLVIQQKHDDYRLACEGKITWRQYVARWGVS